jgi:hypothetical protein
MEVATDAGDGIALRGRLVFDRATRVLRYSVSVYGVSDDDVLFTHIHRSNERAVGPVAHLLGGRGWSRVSGYLTLSAAELTRLRAGELYVDVHTTEDLFGLRADIKWPEEG